MTFAWFRSAKTQFGTLSDTTDASCLTPASNGLLLRSLICSIQTLNRKFLDAILVLSVIFAYGIQPVSAVVIEHEHHSDGHHLHGLVDWLLGFHDHPCDHHDDSPMDSGDDPDGSHSHVLLPGSKGHAQNWLTNSFPLPPGGTLLLCPDFGQRCPDSPTFRLVKPPQ